MNYLDIIKKYGLMVRQIPLEKKETYCAKLLCGIKDWDPDEFNFFWIEINQDGRFNYDKLKEMHKGKENFKFDDENKKVFRHYASRTKTNQDGGMWMCQKSTNTNSNITWSKERDFLAPTLEESIDLFLESIGKDIKHGFEYWFKRLEEVSNKLHPGRPWSNEFRDTCRSEWIRVSLETLIDRVIFNESKV